MTVRRPSRPRTGRRVAATALVPVLALLAACSGDGDGGPAAASGQVLTIGLLAPTSGPNATAGTEAQRGAQLAADVVNGLNPSIPLPLAAEAGLPHLGGAKIKIELQNSGVTGTATPQTVAGNAVNQLVSGKGVDAIVGAYDPLVTEYASQRSERYEVPFVNADSPATYLTDAGRDWFFRIGPSWRSSGEAFLSLLRDQGASPGKMAVLYATDKAGQNVYATVRQLVEEGGEGADPTEIKFSPSATSLESPVDQLVQEKPDTVFLYATPANLPGLGQAFATKNYKPKATLSFALGYLTAEQVAANGAVADGVMRSVSWSREAASRNPAAQAVTSLYQRRYNSAMSESAASAFTAVMTVALAADAAGSTENQQLRSALLSLDVPGEQTIMPWSGIQFDETHQNVLAQALIEQYSNRAFTVVYPPDVAARGTQFLYPAPNGLGG